MHSKHLCLSLICLLFAIGITDFSAAAAIPMYRGRSGRSTHDQTSLLQAEVQRLRGQADELEIRINNSASARNNRSNGADGNAFASSSSIFDISSGYAVDASLNIVSNANAHRHRSFRSQWEDERERRWRIELGELKRKLRELERQQQNGGLTEVVDHYNMLCQLL